MCNDMSVAAVACLKSCMKEDRGRLKQTDHNTHQDMETNNWAECFGGVQVCVGITSIHEHALPNGAMCSA